MTASGEPAPETPKAASAQLAPGSGGKAAGPPPVPDGIAYRKLFRWSWAVVRTAFPTFVLATVLALVAQTLVQYNVQLLTSIVSMLTGSATGAKGGGSFLDSLVPGDLRVAGVLLVVLLLVRIVFVVGARLLTALSDNLMSSRLQVRLHDRLLRLGPDYHRNHDVSSSTLVVSQFAPGSQAIFSDLISFPLLRGVGVVTATVLLVGNLQKLGDPPLWMTGALITALFLLPVGTWWLATKVRRAFVQVRENQKAVQEELLNSLTQPGEVQVLGAESQRSESFGRSVLRLVRSRIRAVLRLEVVNQFQSSVPDVLQAIFLAYGIAYVLRTGDVTAAGPIIGIYYFVPQAVQPVQELMQFYVGIQSSWAQVQDVITVLEAESAVLDSADARDAPDGVQPLQLDDVVYAYEPGGRRILDGLQYTFGPGGVTAVVARSGGGKSTLFNLLCRLYDPQAGAVRFGGIDIRGLHVRSYRHRVAKVSQFPLLIFDTIRANFHLVDPDATDEAIRAVCERTGLWQVLEGVVSGGSGPLDYVLPRAQDQGLSGGERRLLSITRALLTEPAVLLLDEPTTGIDKLGREMLLRILGDLGRRMTIVLVDHNVREFVSEVADEVCVLENGTFTAQGRPADLASRPGLFRSLYEQEGDENAAAAATVGPPPAGVQPTAGLKPGAGGPTLKQGLKPGASDDMKEKQP